MKGGAARCAASSARWASSLALASASACSRATCHAHMSEHIKSMFQATNIEPANTHCSMLLLMLHVWRGFRGGWILFLNSSREPRLCQSKAGILPRSCERAVGSGTGGWRRGGTSVCCMRRRRSSKLRTNQTGSSLSCTHHDSTCTPAAPSHPAQQPCS